MGDKGEYQEQSNLPVYYPYDSEVYLRAAKTANEGELFVAYFNLSYDVHETVDLVFEKPVSSVEMLDKNGKRVPVLFTLETGVTRIRLRAETLMPLIFFSK